MSHSLAELWSEKMSALLTQVRESNRDALARAAALIGPSIANGGVLHVFGSGHSEIVAREIVGRAGGLVCVSAILDPANGIAENVPDFGRTLAERHARLHGMERGEGAIVISNSGRNCSPIDVACVARERGLHVIAVTALAMSTSANYASRHPSGKKLHEVTDVVLDNGGVPGDAIVSLPSSAGGASAGATGPTSTLACALLLNLLHLEIVQWLIDHGHTPPILRSQNLDGSVENNRALAARYRTRLSRPI